MATFVISPDNSTLNLSTNQGQIDLTYRIDDPDNSFNDSLINSARVSIYFSDEVSIDENDILAGEIGGTPVGTISPAGRLSLPDTGNADGDVNTTNFVQLTLQSLNPIEDSNGAVLLSIPFSTIDGFDGETQINFTSQNDSALAVPTITPVTVLENAPALVVTPSSQTVVAGSGEITLNYRLDNFPDPIVSSAAILIFFSNELAIDANNITFPPSIGTPSVALNLADTANGDGDDATTNLVQVSFSPLNVSASDTLFVTIPFVPSTQFDGEAQVNFALASGNPNILLEAIDSVTVAVTNQAPVITSAAEFSVAENITAVGTIAATDADTADVLEYSISGGDDAALFAINSATGALSFVAAPDFETPTDTGANNVYNLQVSVTDGTDAVTQNLTVNVTNVNEAPTIVSPTNFDVEFAENSTAIVIDIDAEDPENDAITFALVGADAALFTISDQGQITFRQDQAPNFEAPADAGADNVYNLQVQVSDDTNIISQDVTVTVTDVNAAPTVTLLNQVTVLDEGTDTTTRIKVANINISDDGEGTNTTSLSGADADLFEIVGTELYLKAGSDLDFQTNPQLDVLVSVDDPTVGSTPDSSAGLTIAVEAVELISENNDDLNTVELVFNPTGDGELSLDIDRISETLLPGSEEFVKVDEGTEAVFDNLVGLYEVIDANGGIDIDGDGVADLTPGTEGFDPGAYALAALNARVQNFTLRAGAGVTTAQQVGDVLLEGGKFYAPFVIANGGAIGVDGFITAENAETDGTFNDAARAVSDAVAYFSFVAANPDGVGHLRSYGNGVFGFEDLPSNLGVSDNDFNDAVFAFNFTAV